jgi:hypothetical protein
MGAMENEDLYEGYNDPASQVCEVRFCFYTRDNVVNEYCRYA